MADELIVLRTFLNKIDAELAKLPLDAAGIVSMIQADDAGGTRPYLWMGGVKLIVRAEDAGRANEILA